MGVEGIPCPRVKKVIEKEGSSSPFLVTFSHVT